MPTRIPAPPPAPRTSAAQRVVGIDLGTTHTVVAWAEPTGTRGPRVFEVPQLVTATELAAAPLFPSVLYAPLAEEGLSDPFGDAPYVLGEHALRRAAEVPGRAVVSSKSWLCHPGVDREAAILPWRPRGEEDEDSDLPKVSPTDAAARLLAHVRVTWDRAFPAFPLATQEVVLTVPASFDEVARELSVRAAERAGLSVRLLEEPQAAFYDLLAQAGPEALTGLLDSDPEGTGALVLVCDVGGGTTDLSLLRVRRGEGSEPLAIERVAVGNHLLLGGDNMDLALAHLAEQRLAQAPSAGDKPRLDPLRFAQLVGACRRAKEQLLGEEPKERVAVTVLAPGSRLFGATRSTELGRDEAEALLLDGFFPAVSRGEKPARARSGLVAFGLPYERDSAITRHVAAFLGRHGAAPRGLLLNGGVFRSPRLRARLVEVLTGFSGVSPQLLPHADPDLAVARGAVAYGLALRGRGLTIQGGLARGYYMGIEGAPGERTAVSLVPRGAREGERHVVSGLPLSLVVGRAVRFDLFARDDGHDPAGTLVTLSEDDFSALPPLVTTLPDSGSSSPRAQGGPRPLATVSVVLEGELSSVGTLDLACVAVDDPERRYRLAFDLRSEAAPVSRAAAPKAVPLAKLEEARALFERAFGRSKEAASPKEVKGLVRELERLFGERPKWTKDLSRALFDALLPTAKGRKRTADHERVFFQLAGYCLRPGVGDPGDPQRAAAFGALFAERISFQEIRVYEQVWIAFRRVAAGLDERVQEAIRDVADPFLAPAEAHLKKPKGWKVEALPQLLELASSLERVDPRRKIELATGSSRKTWTDRDPQLFAALGRLGARMPIYGSQHQVISPRTAERWMDHLLREKWDTAPELFARVAVSLAG
jgi:molecular chaperone DnaK (HSP70)